MTTMKVVEFPNCHKSLPFSEIHYLPSWAIYENLFTLPIFYECPCMSRNHPTCLPKRPTKTQISVCLCIQITPNLHLVLPQALHNMLTAFITSAWKQSQSGSFQKSTFNLGSFACCLALHSVVHPSSHTSAVAAGLEYTYCLELSSSQGPFQRRIADEW